MVPVQFLAHRLALALTVWFAFWASAVASEVPHIKGDWWTIASNPSLGKYQGDHQQPVDFAIWQAADGTWQLWSCIRETKCGGNTRLFYRWEGKHLTDQDWRPVGIAMTARTDVGKMEGGVQAPYVFKEHRIFYMVYGDWQRICLATSTDGKSFERFRNERGQPDLFTGPYDNSRDPMVLKMGSLYYCYYMGHKKGAEFQSAVFCRTSRDLHHWGEPAMVSAGGSAAQETNWFGGDAECPFVVQRNGLYYLFRTQLYGQSNLNTQYASPDPLNFGVGSDRCRISALPVAAPEIVRHEGNDYIAVLKPGLDGIRVARLGWTKK